MESLVATSFHLLPFSVNLLGESSFMFCSVSKDGNKNSYHILHSNTFTKPGSCPAKHPQCVIEALAWEVQLWFYYYFLRPELPTIRGRLRVLWGVNNTWISFIIIIVQSSSFGEYFRSQKCRQVNRIPSFPETTAAFLLWKWLISSCRQVCGVFFFFFNLKNNNLLELKGM